MAHPGGALAAGMVGHLDTFQRTSVARHPCPVADGIWGKTRTKVSSTSKDLDEENPCIDRGPDEGQHGAGKDPLQPPAESASRLQPPPTKASGGNRRIGRFPSVQVSGSPSLRFPTETQIA